MGMRRTQEWPTALPQPCGTTTQVGVGEGRERKHKLLRPFPLHDRNRDKSQKDKVIFVDHIGFCGLKFVPIVLNNRIPKARNMDPVFKLLPT